MNVFKFILHLKKKKRGKQKQTILFHRNLAVRTLSFKSLGSLRFLNVFEMRLTNSAFISSDQ